MQSGSPARVQLNDVDIGMVVRGGFIVLDVPADVHTPSTDMRQMAGGCTWQHLFESGGQYFFDIEQRPLSMMSVLAEPFSQSGKRAGLTIGAAILRWRSTP